MDEFLVGQEEMPNEAVTMEEGMEEGILDQVMAEVEEPKKPKTRKLRKTTKKKSKNKKDKERLEVAKRLTESSNLSVMDKILMGGGELTEESVQVENESGEGILSIYITDFKPSKRKKKRDMKEVLNGSE